MFLIRSRLGYMRLLSGTGLEAKNRGGTPGQNRGSGTESMSGRGWDQNRGDRIGYKNWTKKISSQTYHPTNKVPSSSTPFLLLLLFIHRCTFSDQQLSDAQQQDVRHCGPDDLIYQYTPCDQNSYAWSEHSDGIRTSQSKKLYMFPYQLCIKKGG